MACAEAPFCCTVLAAWVCADQCSARMHRNATCMQACQNGDSYTDVLAAHADSVSSSLDSEAVRFEVFLPCSSYVFSFFNVVSDCAFFVDIVLNFLTGFIPRRSSVPEYNFKRIAANYIQDTFVFDAIATFPWEQVSISMLKMAALHMHAVTDSCFSNAVLCLLH
jgi:hypothetical protein